MRFSKTVNVDVNVDVTLDDVLDELSDKQIRDLCRQRDIPLRGERREDTFSIDLEDLALVGDRLSRGQVEDALIGLERLLPSNFRRLSVETRRYFEHERQRFLARETQRVFERSV